MIVVDTNVLAYFIVGGAGSEDARTLLSRDREWIAPALWRSEFRNVLITAFRAGRASLTAARDFMRIAERRMRFADRTVTSERVLELASGSRLSAYDCEFVAVAQDTGVPLVTADRRIVIAFPGTAQLLSEFIR